MIAPAEDIVGSVDSGNICNLNGKYLVAPYTSTTSKLLADIVLGYENIPGVVNLESVQFLIYVLSSGSRTIAPTKICANRQIRKYKLLILIHFLLVIFRGKYVLIVLECTCGHSLQTSLNYRCLFFNSLEHIFFLCADFRVAFFWSPFYAIRSIMCWGLVFFIQICFHCLISKILYTFFTSFQFILWQTPKKRYLTAS